MRLFSNVHINFYFYLQRFFFFLEEMVKLNSYWRNQNTPIVFNDQRYYNF